MGVEEKIVSSIKDIIENIPETDGDNVNPDIIMDPDYLDESSKIISDALHKGFDILQLDNGDIVTTGTKVIVTQYRWDDEKKKMVKLTARDLKKKAAPKKSAAKKKPALKKKK